MTKPTPRPTPDPSCTGRFRLTAVETALVLDALSMAVNHTRDEQASLWPGSGGGVEHAHQFRRAEEFRALLLRLSNETHDREPCGDAACPCARDLG